MYMIFDNDHVTVGAVVVLLHKLRNVILRSTQCQRSEQRICLPMLDFVDRIRVRSWEEILLRAGLLANFALYEMVDTQARTTADSTCREL